MVGGLSSHNPVQLSSHYSNLHPSYVETVFTFSQDTTSFHPITASSSSPVSHDLSWVEMCMKLLGFDTY